MFRNFSTMLLAGALLLGCAKSAPPLTAAAGQQLAVVSAKDLPPPSGFRNDGTAPVYQLAAFDEVEIDVYGVPEMSKRLVKADAAGRISFPLAGTIEAAGLTTDQLADELQSRLRTYVRRPQVTVNLMKTTGQVVTVDGEVREPGLYPVIGRTTLMRSVALAKGTSEFARLTEVVVFRRVGEQDMAALYDLKAIRNGLYPDPQIYPNDVVIVGNSPARRLFRDVLQASPLLTSPIVAVLSGGQ